MTQVFMKRFDDLDDYLATLDGVERDEVHLAETAIDVAVMFHRARTHRGLTQVAAAERTGFAQQAISRIERPHTNIQLATLQRYLGALGYEVELLVKDANTGEVAASVLLGAGSS